MKRVICIVLSVVLPAAMAAAGGSLEAARAAAADRLYDVAYAQCRAALDEKTLATPSERAEAMHLLMVSCQQQNKFGEIPGLLDNYKHVVAAMPSPGFDAFWRGLALFKANRCAEAIAELRDFESRFPGSVYCEQADRVRAVCLARAGRFGEALQEYARFDAAHGASPANADNLLDWGRTLVEAGAGDEARRVLRRLSGMEGASPAVAQGRFALARLLIDDKQYGAAEELLHLVTAATNVEESVKADAWYAMAAVCEAQMNWDDALWALISGIEASVTGSQQRRGGMELGRLLIDRGRVNEGIPLLKRNIAADPRDPAAERAQLKLAAALLAKDRHDEAAREYQHYLETYTNRAGVAEAYEGLGWGLLNGRRFSEAATAFSRAEQMASEPAQKQQSLFKVGDAYFANGQYKLALDTYQRLVSLHPKSQLVPSAVFQVGECRAALGDLAGAEESLNSLIAGYPESPLVEEALLRLAELKQKAGRWEDAIQGFNRVMTVYSNGAFMAEALFGRGIVNYNLFRYGEAMADFARVVQDFPVSDVAEESFHKRAMCLYWMGKDEESLAMLRSFLARYPKSPLVPEVIFWMGKYHFNRGLWVEAEKNFLQVPAGYPRHERADEALLWAGLASARRQEYVHSVELLTRLVRDYPGSTRIPQARLAQAEALSELGNYSAAIVTCDEIINRYPNSGVYAAALERKGDCQFSLGSEDARRYQEAMDSYRAAANSPAATPDVVLQAEYKIGRCLERMGKTSEALEQYHARVVTRYLADRGKGVRHSESSKTWFTRAAFNAVDLLEAQGRRAEAIAVLDRVVGADVPASQEARERAQRLKARVHTMGSAAGGG